MSTWLAFRIRWLDRPAALALGAVLAPLLVLVAACVRMVDGSPVVVRLQRVGQHGQPFSMFKLRSMTQPAGSSRAGGSALTAGDDPRVTPLGRVLRRYHLDELPQLLNVLRGEMAIMGPRPETPEYVDLTDDRWKAVLQAPPAMAGPTQVLASQWEADLPAGPEGHGRYVSTILSRKLRIDAWYVGSASGPVDCAVVVALLQRFVLRSPRTRVHQLLEADGIAAECP